MYLNDTCQRLLSSKIIFKNSFASCFFSRLTMTFFQSFSALVYLQCQSHYLVDQINQFSVAVTLQSIQFCFLLFCFFVNGYPVLLVHSDKRNVLLKKISSQQCLFRDGQRLSNMFHRTQQVDNAFSNIAWIMFCRDVSEQSVLLLLIMLVIAPEHDKVLNS